MYQLKRNKRFTFNKQNSFIKQTRLPIGDAVVDGATEGKEPGDEIGGGVNGAVCEDNPGEQIILML